MSSMGGRVALGAAVVVVAVVLFVVLKGGNGNHEAATGNGGVPTAGQGGPEPGGKPGAPIPTIVIKDGKPVGGVAELTYSEGERVRFKVRSDVSDEVHVHGYDVMKDVRAGGSVSFDFPASIEGVFEGELENRAEQILELRVNP